MSGHLQLAPGIGTQPPLADLVAKLARGHLVAAHDPGLGPPAAVLAPASAPLGHRGPPVALWVGHTSEVPDELHPRVRVVVTWRPVVEATTRLREVATTAGVPIEVVPAPSVDGTEWRPVVPFVRARWRRRFGLPVDLVVAVGVPGAPALDEATANDALFLCSAAVVGPGHILRAMALATPVVCDAATADLVGAEDGRHVLVAGGDARAAAGELARDLRRSAVLGREARRLVEARHDLAASAARVAAALGLPRVGPAPIARLAGRLSELGTPVNAPITGTVAAAVGTLGGVDAEAAVRSLRW